jgi:hypothetical protein
MTERSLVLPRTRETTPEEFAGAFPAAPVPISLKLRANAMNQSDQVLNHFFQKNCRSQSASPAKFRDKLYL